MLFFFVLGELLMRVQSYGLDGFSYQGMNSVKRVLMSEFAIEPQRRSQATVGSWGLLPNTRGFNKGAAFEVNNLGLRGEDATLKKPPGTFRIVVLGGSLSMGAGIELVDSWPHSLAKRLNASLVQRRKLNRAVLLRQLKQRLHADTGAHALKAAASFPERYEVFNLALPNTRRCLMNQISRAIHFQPDLILWQIGKVGSAAEFKTNYVRAIWLAGDHRVPLLAFALDHNRHLPPQHDSRFFELLPPLGIEYGPEHYIYPSDDHPDAFIHQAYAEHIHDQLVFRLPALQARLAMSQQNYASDYQPPELQPWIDPDPGFWECYLWLRMSRSFARTGAELSNMQNPFTRQPGALKSRVN